MDKIKTVKTNGQNPDFLELCKLLDQNLDKLVGGAVQREQFTPFNKTDDIRMAVVLYKDSVPVASGCLREYSCDTGEVKRIFVKQEHRGQGLSKTLMAEIEKMAIAEGFLRLILETGAPLKASIGLYNSIGFKQIPNYDPYKNIRESICMEKTL